MLIKSFRDLVVERCILNGTGLTLNTFSIIISYNIIIISYNIIIISYNIVISYNNIVISFIIKITISSNLISSFNTPFFLNLISGVSNNKMLLMDACYRTVD